MINEILEKAMEEENIITLNSNVGVVMDLVIEAMERDPVPVVHF
jgi:hypothetical protein